MIDLIDFTLELVFGTLDLFNAWRFSLCLFITAALAALVYWQIANQTARLATAIPILIVGVTTGIIGEYRAS